MFCKQQQQQQPAGEEETAVNVDANMARQRPLNDALPNAVAPAQTSTALISFVKETRTAATSAQHLGTVSVTLHSDLAPLGVTKFVSFLHGETGGGAGAPGRLFGGEATQPLALEFSAMGQLENAPRDRRREYNQHHFPHNRRGLLSLVDGKNDRSGGDRFLITLGTASDFDPAHLVFGTIDLFDASSATALDEIEQTLVDGDGGNISIRISDCRLIGLQFRDLLDGAYGSNINWGAVRSLLALQGSHPGYKSNARWDVNYNGTRPRERNILQATLYHRAPPDVLSDAINVVSQSDFVSPDPIWMNFCNRPKGLLPLSMACNRSVDRRIIDRIVEEMDGSGEALELFTKAFEDVYISHIEEHSLCLLLDRIGCDRKAILPLLEKAVDGFQRLGRKSEKPVSWYREFEGAVKSSEGLVGVWNNICCLLYAIEFGEVKSRIEGRSRTPFSPLGTLFRLGQARPYYHEPGCLWHHPPELPAKCDYCFTSFDLSVFRLVEFLGDQSASTLYLPDCRGKSPVHYAANAFYTYCERRETPYDEFVRHFDGCTIKAGFDLEYGEKILSYFLEHGDPECVLAKDGDGESVLNLLLKEKLRRPLVRIQLVLEAFPELCLEMGSSEVLPFCNAMSLPDEIEEEGSVMEQLYITNLLLAAHMRLGVGFDLSTEDVLLRFKDTLDTSKRYLGEYDDHVLAAAMMQAARLLRETGNAEMHGSSVLIELIQMTEELCTKLDCWTMHASMDSFEAAVKSLLAACMHDPSDIPFSHLAKKAFHRSDGDYDGLYDEYSYEENCRPSTNNFYRHVVEVALRALPSERRGGLQDTTVLPFLESALPYYKTMAKDYTDYIEEVRGEESPPEYTTTPKEERLAESYEELKLVVAEAESCLDLFLQGTGYNLNSAKHLLRAVLLGSDVDPPASSRMCDGKCLLIAAVKGGCSETMEDLLSAAPDCIALRERGSFLYPFQLAACSEKASIDDVFVLLRRQPSLVDDKS